MREIAITVKPTLSCNMKCKHCFNGNKFNKSKVISVDRVILLLDKASKEYDVIKLTFHGGEPTLAGKEFYRKIFEFQNRVNKENRTCFRNLFTTNGLLLDEEFIDILIENNTLINVSYDGPYNDILRQNSDKVLDNIKTIQHKNGRIRCYCTLSQSSFSHLEEIYNWFKSQRLDFKTLPVDRYGYAKINDNIIIKPQQLVETLTNVYKKWLYDKDCKIRYYTFEEFSKLRRKMQFKNYWFNRKIALNPDGNIYPFGRPNDVNYCLGTPESINKIEDCFNSEIYHKLKNTLEGFFINKCKFCESIDVCNGVSICMAYMYENDEEILDYGCNQSNLIFQRILAINDGIIEDFKKGYTEAYTDTIKRNFAEFISSK